MPEIKMKTIFFLFICSLTHFQRAHKFVKNKQTKTTNEHDAIARQMKHVIFLCLSYKMEIKMVLRVRAQQPHIHHTDKIVDMATFDM